MDLNFSDAHQAFQREVVGFLAAHAHEAPRAGTGVARAWQTLLIAHG